MDAQSRKFLDQLLTTPGTSGYEVDVQKVVRDYLAGFADAISTDLHGNVIACKNPGREMRVMFAGHCDQIGLIVSHIDDLGFLYFQRIGGWDPNQLIGQRLSVWTKSGPVNGVCSRKAIHLLDDKERETPLELKDLWIDIGSKNREESESKVQIGDSVTLQLGLQEMANDMINAPACDDRSGLWVCVEAFRRADPAKLNCSLYVASTVAEEIGLRGAQTAAFSIDPHVGIAVDVTHATDCPTIDQRQQGEVSIGGGPVVFRGPNMNPQVVQRLTDISEKRKSPFQVAAIGRAASNDSNALQVSRGGVAAGCIGVPNRYMHSAVEVISLNDIEDAANLLAEFAVSCDDPAEFIPQ